MLKTIAFISILSIASFPSIAQKYTTAAGIRIGSGIGITVQQHVFNKLTIEGTLQKNLFRSGTTVAAILERHQKIGFKDFNFYLGGGPHAEYMPATRVYDDKGNSYTVNNNSWGISGVAGIELRLKNILVSYDYQPGINIHGGDQLFSSKTGISVRYVFLKQSKKKKKNKKNEDWKFWKKWEQGYQVPK